MSNKTQTVDQKCGWMTQSNKQVCIDTRRYCYGPRVCVRQQ